MGTEVLRPQDCLRQKLTISPPIFHRKNNTRTGNATGNFHRKPNIGRRSASLDDIRNNNKKCEVTIVRRGNSIGDPRGFADVYAGSAVSTSPSPTSVPLPSFFSKKPVRVSDDFATRDLRRLLRLD